MEPVMERFFNEPIMVDLSESIKNKEGTLQMFIQEGTPTDQLIKEIDTLKARLQTMQCGSKRGRRRRRRSTRRR